MKVAAFSAFYRTPAHPPGSGPDFVNAAARIVSNLGAGEILDSLHEVEAALGRTRPERWAPRVVDLDLLAHEEAVLPDASSVRAWMALDDARAAQEAPAELILPHPRLHERAFVLIPLCDIALDWKHPLTGQSVAEMAAALPQEARAGITRL